MTTQLIKIQEQNGQKLVNARELHEFLGVQSRYNDWIRNRVEKFGFIENQDFVTLTKNLVNGGSQKEHGLTFDMAKELCMLENNDKGRQARRYFIEMEKQALNKGLTVPTKKELASWVIELEEKTERQQKEIKKLTKKSEFADRILISDRLVDIGQAAKILDLPYGRNTLFQLLREKGIFFKERNEPKQEYVNKGYFTLKEVLTHQGLIFVKVGVTQKGLEYLSGLFNKKLVNNKFEVIQINLVFNCFILYNKRFYCY